MSSSLDPETGHDLTAQGFLGNEVKRLTDGDPTPRRAVPSAEGVSVVRRLGADPVPAAHGSVLTEDGVLVAVQLRLGHHQAGVVLGAAVFDTCIQEVLRLQ